MAGKKKDSAARGRRPAKAAKPSRASGERAYFSQTDFPQVTLQDAQRIAVGIWENFAGKGASPPNVALAIGMSPTSSTWRAVCGSSIAYGLTTGGPNAETITLTPLGRRLVAPETEGDDVRARGEAVTKPRILREFFERYRRAKFPNDVIGANVLASMGLPKDRAAAGIELVKANGYYAGAIRDTPTGPFVNMESPVVPSPAATAAPEDDAEQKPDDESGPRGMAVPPLADSKTPPAAPATVTPVEQNRVFISHGKQRTILAQIKELLTFGKFEPLVSVERESTAISVPEKVFEDMRACFAGVIHVSAEAELLDTQGNRHVKINDNVLIEIGAALALYGKKIILLVERGVTLPSNLQGLYRCEYEGDRLDYDATMKLLKTFNQFR